MSIDIQFDDGDLQRWLQQQAETLPDQLMDDQAAEFQREVEALTCPTHGKHPEVTITGSRRGTILERKVEIGEFCCDEFAETVQAHIDLVTDSGSDDEEA
jgi:hypothetical protein